MALMSVFFYIHCIFDKMSPFCYGSDLLKILFFIVQWPVRAANYSHLRICLVVSSKDQQDSESSVWLWYCWKRVVVMGVHCGNSIHSCIHLIYYWFGS